MGETDGLMDSAESVEYMTGGSEKAFALGRVLTRSSYATTKGIYGRDLLLYNIRRL